MTHFADRLLARCRKLASSICVGIDPVFERLPPSIRRHATNPRSARQAVQAIEQFVTGVLHAVADHAPCVKFQSACFERYLWPGVEAYHKLIAQARQLGFIVIADAKRGDIDITAAHYAAACLDDPPFDDLDLSLGPDALTVNPYFGADGLNPFLQVAAQKNKGLFALVRTSNPSSDSLQALTLDDGTTVAQAVAALISQLGSDPALLGSSGYSLLGAVVGATKSHEAAQLRRLMPQQWFLVPGFGAQGAQAHELKEFFNPDGSGAIITASRSILYAFHTAPHHDWQHAIALAAADMKNQIASALPTPAAQPHPPK